MSSHDQEIATSSQRHLVRPRWVWGGLVLSLIGAGVLSLGIALLSGTLSAIGVLLLLAGAGVSLRGGVIHDSGPNFALAKELRQVRDGDVHEAVVPSETVNTRQARQDAVASNALTRELEAAAHHTAKVPLAPVAGWLLVLVTAVLTMSLWKLGDIFSGTGLAILLVPAGLRVAVTSGRHRIAASIILLTGLGLMLGGLLAEHDDTGLAMLEATSGCVAVLCSLAAHISPSSHRPDQQA